MRQTPQKLLPSGMTAGRIVLQHQPSTFSTATLFPDFAEGWIVIDSRDAPRLANAIGSRIYLKARNASAKLAQCRGGRNDAEYLHAVPVDGPNGVFALDFIGADGVTVNARGEIRLYSDRHRQVKS